MPGNITAYCYGALYVSVTVSLIVARDKAGLDAKDEKFQLKDHISRQREQIILKGKAATAGWDAAAHSDER